MSKHFSTLTISNEPANKDIIFQHVIYELIRHKDLKMRAKTGFHEKRVFFHIVVSAYSMYFDFVKTGLNQKYNYFIDTFDLQFQKWVGLINPTRHNICKYMQNDQLGSKVPTNQVIVC